MVMRGGSAGSVEFPSLVGLLHHPDLGHILYDTGYSRHFMNATKSFPECLYRMVTPPSLPPEEELLSQLEERGIGANDVSLILISHFHGDHVAGLKDFPRARFIATRGEYDEMEGKGRVAQLRSAFLPALLPDDFLDRVTFVEELGLVPTGLQGYEVGYDISCDSALIGLDLPGHTRSQLGLAFTDERRRRLLMVGDACWKLEGLQSRRLPSRIASILFSDSAAYEETFFKLADLHENDSSLTIIPSHCESSWKREQGLGRPTREGGDNE
jgi:glyoxylase-like metal-dependent hydrolase (beta-lactamase superfamily II)